MTLFIDGSTPDLHCLVGFVSLNTHHLERLANLPYVFCILPFTIDDYFKNSKLGARKNTKNKTTFVSLWTIKWIKWARMNENRWAIYNFCLIQQNLIKRR